MIQLLRTFLFLLCCVGPALAGGFDAGPTGGTTTPIGPQGNPGCAVLFTSGAPAASLGQPCDFALDPLAGIWYGPKDPVSGWSAGVAMRPTLTSPAGPWTPSYPSLAMFQTALSSLSGVAVGSFVRVETPGCPLDYLAVAGATGVYGELSGAGVFWEPQYSNNPVRMCEFGVVGDASYEVNGSVGIIAVADGSNTITVTSEGGTSGLGVGGLLPWRITCYHWHSKGCALPAGATITVADATHLTLSTPLAAGTYDLYPYIALSPSNITGTDNAIPAQAALNYALQHGYQHVLAPSGVIYISQPLMLGWGNAFTTIWLQGDGELFAVGTHGTAFLCVNAPLCLVTQGGRNDVVSDLSLQSYGINYNQWLAYGYFLSPDPIDYMPPEVYAATYATSRYLINAGNRGGSLFRRRREHLSLSPADLPGLDRAHDAVRQGTHQQARDPERLVRRLHRGLHEWLCRRKSGFHCISRGQLRLQRRLRQHKRDAVAQRACRGRQRQRRLDRVRHAHLRARNRHMAGPDHQRQRVGHISMGQWLWQRRSSALRRQLCQGFRTAGNTSCSPQYGAPLIFDGGGFVSSEADSFSPASLITVTAGTGCQISFEHGFQITLARIGTLVAGGPYVEPIELKIDDLEVVSGVFAGAEVAATASDAQAINYSGLLLYGVPKYAFGLDWTHVLTQTGMGCAAAGCSAGDAQRFAEITRGGTRVNLNQATKGFTGNGPRVWRMDVPVPLTIQNNSSWFSVAPTTSGETLSGTYLNSQYLNGGRYAPANGWIFQDEVSGTNWVMRPGAPRTAPAIGRSRASSKTTRSSTPASTGRRSIRSPTA